jgi:hypothetical protein
MAEWGVPGMDVVSRTPDACHTNAEGDGMDQAEYLVRDHPDLGPGVKRVKLECSHGRTFGLLIPGTKPISVQVALDLLAVRHDGQHQCHCTTGFRPGTAEFGAGADAQIPPGRSHRPTATALERSDA